MYIYKNGFGILIYIYLFDITIQQNYWTDEVEFIQTV